MTVTCPCCRAGNDVGPACRRCKADLALLFAVESRREFLLSEVHRLAGSEPRAALAKLDEAEMLRPGPELLPLRATLHLLLGDFANAARLGMPA